MTSEQRQRLRLEIDRAQRERLLLSPPSGQRRSCAAYAKHSGDPCHFWAVEGRRYCTRHAEREAAAA